MVFSGAIISTIIARPATTTALFGFLLNTHAHAFAGDAGAVGQQTSDFGTIPHDTERRRDAHDTTASSMRCALTAVRCLWPTCVS